MGRLGRDWRETMSLLAYICVPHLALKSPALIWGSRAGAPGAEGWTSRSPARCLPALPSPAPRPLCAPCTLCLQVPGAEEAPMGRDQPRRMSVEGRFPASPVSLHPQCLPAGPVAPLPTPFIPGLLRAWGSQARSTPSECRELAVGSRKEKTSPCTGPCWKYHQPLGFLASAFRA